MDRFKKYNTEAIKTQWKLNWGVNRFKLLGITFDIDLDKILNLNFSEKMSKIRTKISFWKRRNLTPLAKITVIKSLLLSSMNHLFISLPNPNEKMMKEMNDILYEFIWEGTSRIKKTTLYQDYCDGGLKMIDINSFITRYKRIGYNLNVMRQSACLVFNPIMVDNYAAFFNCTPVGRASDSMMAPT